MEDRAVPSLEEVNELFANSDPDAVWGKAVNVIRLINPDYDFSLVQTAFQDVVALFHGEYPGYAPVKTPYHDLAHTLHVFLCAVRLMHGVHISGDSLTDKELALVAMGALMHDIGYAQTRDDEAGTGAQYTRCHVTRGIEFMRHYLTGKEVAPDVMDRLESIIRCTDPGFPFEKIVFLDSRTRLLGQLVATADLVGQMADRTYLEKLLFLYLEFKEAHFGNFQNVHEMLRQTTRFYDITREKLDAVYEGLYTRLSDHFMVTMGVPNNYYIESIEKNITYLAEVTRHEEAEHFAMLKRNGIADKAKSLPDFN